MLEKYGDKTNLQFNDVKQKRINSLKKRLTIEKRNNTVKERYKVDNIRNCDIIDEKIKQTNLKLLLIVVMVMENI